MSRINAIIMTPDEEETATFMVCESASDSSIFTDDVLSRCSECGDQVRHRPHKPAHLKPVCFPCALPAIREALKSGDLRLGISGETKKELDRFGNH